MTENTALPFRSSQWQLVPDPVSVFWLMFLQGPCWGEGKECSEFTHQFTLLKLIPLR